MGHVERQEEDPGRIAQYHGLGRFSLACTNHLHVRLLYRNTEISTKLISINIFYIPFLEMGVLLTWYIMPVMYELSAARALPLTRPQALPVLVRLVTKNSLPVRGREASWLVYRLTIPPSWRIYRCLVLI